LLHSPENPASRGSVRSSLQYNLLFFWQGVVFAEILGHTLVIKYEIQLVVVQLI
jgi:hypothetical protein